MSNTDTIKSIALNIGIVVITSLVALLVLKLDEALNLYNFQKSWSVVLGSVILLVGIIFRFWASSTFYQNKVEVLSLKPQDILVKKSPYSFSRNPLFIGIVSIAFGIMLIVGSVSGVVASILLFIFWDLYVRFVEEKQLEKTFGEEYLKYKKSTPRWISWRRK